MAEKTAQTTGIEPTAAPLSPVASQAPEKRTTGADVLLDYAAAAPFEIDEASNKRILWKIDTHILPWLCSLYIFQYLDKGVLSYSSVMGIKTNAHLTSNEYSWLGSIYYLGYMAALPIHNRLFQLYTPSKYIAVTTMLWGLVLACMPACNNFRALMVQRVFMGCLESSVNCGFLLLTARWYRKYEHGARVSIWASMNGLATIIGALIAYGCLAGVASGVSIAMYSWKIMALCLGCVSIVFGAAMWYFMAPSLLEATFFSDEDRAIAIARLRGNHQGIGSGEFKWYQVREAFMDVRTWLYVLFVLTSQIPAGGISLMASILIESLNFTSEQTLLLNMPGGALQVILQWAAGYTADRTQQRSLVALALQLISLLAASLLIGFANVSPLYNRPGQLAGYFLMIGACAIGYYLLLAMVASNVLGTTKKTTTNVILFLAMAIAYLVGPQVFVDEPYYYRAKNATVGLWAAACVTMIVIYALNRWENARRDREVSENGYEAAEGLEFLDLTDKENKKFRYVL